MDNISKSLYCNYIECKKQIWLSKYKKEEYVETKKDSVMENGNEVGDLARHYFGEYSLVNFDINLDNMVNETKKFIDNNKHIICEASFRYKNLFASIDILKIKNNRVSIYEVKSSTEIRDIYIDDASFQAYLLEKLGYDIESVNVMHLNPYYELDGELNLKKLFIIENITDRFISKKDEIKNNIDDINNILSNKNEPNIDLGVYCFKPYNCPFFKYCSRNINENNIFDIKNMTINKKIDLYNKGLIYFKDLINSNINNKYKEQIDFELNNRDTKIDKNNIKKFMNSLNEPIYFLDFETYQDAIPIYQMQGVYEQVPFQYSLHYYDKNNNLKHKEYLSESGIDPRRGVAEALVKDIPTNVDVLAYNCSFEKRVIKKLAYLYPDLKDNLLKIYNNIKDLMIPFFNRDYYCKDMHGSYSIKYVLPALFPDDPSLNYHNLDLVHNGSEAMNTFKNLGNYSKEEQEKIRHSLLKYCELDTYAMVKIYDKLKNIE